MIKQLIHTSLSLSTINKLKGYGKGRINAGIEIVLKIAESKKSTIVIVTEVII